MNKLNELTLKMIAYYQNDPKRIQHFIKVHNFARLIGEQENLDHHTLFILEAASIVHDIGIKPAEEKYGSCAGKLQEQEGSAPARIMLKNLQFESEIIDRICYLVAHHHTYQNVDGMDYQILLEADFLVNLYEDGVSLNAVKTALDRIFHTKTGINICQKMFGIEEFHN